MGDDNINEIYLDLLKKQFCEAYGLRKFDNHSKKYLEGLQEFIKLRQALSRKYNRFLKYMGLDITTNDIAELNKGNADTIIKSYDTLAITPYPIDIEQERLYSSVEPGIKRFITHNPYYKQEIKTLAKYYNEDEYDILFGVFGKISDKDSHRKMKELLTLAKKIKDNQYRTGMLKDNNDYFGIVYTHLNETKHQFEDMKKAIEKGRIIEAKTR